jgi:integrase/recombinase XerD
MDQTTNPSHSAVLDRDDAPFADERYRYLRYCAEGGATAASLKIKRNELLWIAARLGPDAAA